MDWQQIAALLIVGLAAFSFAWPKLRKKKKFSFEKDTHCGCAGGESPGPKQSIVFSARKGERPQIIVKNQPNGGLR